MDRALLHIRTDLAGEPLHCFGARLEYIAAVAADLRRNQRLKRLVELRLQFAQAGVGETAERYMASAARKNADPRLAVRANPQPAVIVAVRVGVVTGVHERRRRAAVVAH